MASSLDSSRSTVPTTPTMYYETKFTAKAVADSKDAIISWWKTNKTKEPFTQLVADRLSDEPNACILRVGLGYQNEGVTILDVFQKALIKCNDLPPKNMVEFVLENLNNVYEIAGRHYKIEKLISDRGSYGDVFLACDQDTKEKAVIKILRISADREHRMLEKLQKNGPHPNIVQYFGYASIKEKIWIAMEYIPGQTYRQYLNKNSWNAELQQQYDNALQFIEKTSIDSIRENDRENVLITLVDGKPTVKLIDFGTLATN